MKPKHIKRHLIPAGSCCVLAANKSLASFTLYIRMCARDDDLVTEKKMWFYEHCERAISCVMSLWSSLSKTNIKRSTPQSFEITISSLRGQD